MDVTVILTGLGTVVAIVGSNIALISWLRSEIKALIKNLQIRYQMTDRLYEMFIDIIKEEKR